MRRTSTCRRSCCGKGWRRWRGCTGTWGRATRRRPAGP